MNTIENKKEMVEAGKSIQIGTTRKARKLIEVKNLKTYFYTEEGVVKAVDGV